MPCLDTWASLLAGPGIIAVGDSNSFCLIRTVLDEAEVLTIATDPAQRRKGLARNVLQSAEELATARGAKEIFLEVAEDNLAAISLYASFNYRQIGRRAGYYLPKDAAPIAALVLRKSLATG